MITESIHASVVGWFLVVGPLCWGPVLAADTTQGEKNLGIGVLALACVLLSFVVGVIALLLTSLCLADYVQRRRRYRADLRS